MAMQAGIPSPLIISLGEYSPEIHESTWIAPNAVVVGRVKIGAQSSVWFNVTIRGDVDDITIGERSNIQDGTVIHVDKYFPTIIGDNVTVGHNAILHGCTVEDDALIGIGSIVLNGAVIQKKAMVGAGAVVPPGMVVPSGSVVMGMPAKVKRELTEEEKAHLWDNADHYVQNAIRFRNNAL